MILVFLAIAIIILVMIIVMTTIFKRTVKVIDEQSKNYFVCKLQVYDDLIETKQTKLEELNKQIEELQNQQITTVVEEDDDDTDEARNVLDVAIPSYRDEDIFEKYKKIDEKFSFDNEEIVSKFIKEHKKNISKKKYKHLLDIKNKITFDITYDLITKTEKQQLETLKALLDTDEYEIVNKYLENKEEFSFNDFKVYLNDLIQDGDPYIYVKVSKKEENYNHLDSCIKTIYDPDIFKGIVIIYQNKLYDFSLN